MMLAHFTVLPKDFAGLRLLLNAEMTLVGRKGYVDVAQELRGFLETTQFVVLWKNGSAKVLDDFSENGTLVVRARSAETYLSARAAQSPPTAYPEQVMPDLIEHPEDIIVLERPGPTEEPVLISLQSGDLVDHVYATWRVVLS